MTASVARMTAKKKGCTNCTLCLDIENHSYQIRMMTGGSRMYSRRFKAEPSMPATVENATMGQIMIPSRRMVDSLPLVYPVGSRKYTTALPVTMVLNTNKRPTRRMSVFWFPLYAAFPLDRVSVARYAG